MEALSLGVPMVALPQWMDQKTNAKYIMDVWKIGLKAPCDERGVVRQEAVEHCISEIMEGGKGKEIQRNSIKWRGLARKAVCVKVEVLIKTLMSSFQNCGFSPSFW
ncbi:unnamed protein product [Prunus brigantina]